MTSDAPSDAHLLREALRTIRMLRQQQIQQGSIAIVGIGCRFPGDANSPDDFWTALEGGRDLVTPIPSDRWDADYYYDPDPTAPGKICTRVGGFLSRKDLFDPQFFKISPREAMYMDPQQRVLLEVAWEALEHAHIPAEKLKGTNTGVFIGISAFDYANLVAEYLPEAEVDPTVGTGSGHSPASGRLSYFFGFRGPSIAVDTACSSSLVSVQTACESLRRGDCNMALAGGVNMILSPFNHVVFSRAQMLAPDGRCKTFDQAADGYVRSEGAAVLVLKRLADAVNDRNTVLAVIKGGAVNHAGASGGLTVPNGPAQQEVIRAALRNAGITPGSVDYVEAHGTGTALGDPIEVIALGDVYADGRDRQRPLLLGSAKTNVGHMEAAAGVCGLVKVILQLQHGAIAPHLHLANPSNRIPWARLPVSVPTQLTPWPARPGIPRRAGVSSYGFSGTNAHLIVEEAPPPRHQPAVEADRPVHVLALSTKEESALHELVDRYATSLESAEGDAADLAYSANAGRSHFRHRLAVIGASTADMRQQLMAWKRREPTSHVVVGSAVGNVPPKLAFLFTGQGSEAAGMGRELYQTNRQFRDVIDECDRLVRREQRWSLVEVLYGNRRPEEVQQTRFAQPLLFALEYALASLWRSWGIEPACVLGHSVGEFAAAAFAGVFTMEDGLRLVLARGELMQALPADGAMVAIHAPLEAVESLVAPYRSNTSVAAINSPRDVVVSGALASIGAIVTLLQRAGVRTQMLPVSRAFHSPLMAPMLDAFADAAAAIRYASPQLAVVSTATGAPATAELASPEYWVRQVSLPVRFLEGIRAIHDTRCNAFVEVGPKATLLSMARASSPSRGGQFLASLDPARGDWNQIVNSLAALYVSGHPVDWAAFDRGYARRWVALPTYPFQRGRYWFAPDEAQGKIARRAQPRRHPLLGTLTSPSTAVAGGSISDVVFESRIGEETPAFLRDHRVLNSAILPAAAFIELGMAAGAVACGIPPTLKQVSILTPLVLSPGCTTILQTTVTRQGNDWRFEVRSRSEADADGEPPPSWQLHAKGILDVHAPEVDGPTDLAALRQQLTTVVDCDAYYQSLHARGLEYGPSFQCIQELLTDGDRVLGRVQVPSHAAKGDSGYFMHPIVLDGAFQTVAASLGPLADDAMYLPTGVESVQAFQTVGAEHWVEARVRSDAGARKRRVVVDVRVFDATGKTAVRVNGLQLTRVQRAMLRRALEGDPRELIYALTWRRSPIDRHRVAQRDSRRSLIVADRGGVGERVCRLLQQAGTAAVLVAPPGDAGVTPGLSSLLAESNQELLYFAGLDVESAPIGATLSLEHTGNLGCDRLLDVVTRVSRSSGLWLFTRGAVAVDGRSAVGFGQAALSGLLTTIRAEGRVARCAHLDLDAHVDASSTDIEARQIAAEILGGDDDDRIAFRRGLRHVARLQPVTGRGAAAQPCRVALATPGVVENLTIEPLDRRPPGRGEIEVAVKAAGLNFKDVLRVLGLLGSELPDDGIELGFECSGIVSAVGDGVVGRKVGDPVIVFGTGCLRSHVIAAAETAVDLPSNLTFEEAASVPTAFLTAYHALHALAQIQPGDTVLVHAGAGGVGQAAIQLCRRIGATVFATASASKADFVKLHGVSLVMNSRDLSFREAVLEATGGRGVDVVLNSLNGDFIQASLDVLARGGRFVEIGKLGAWTPAAVASIRPDAAYFTFDLSEAQHAVAGSFRQVLTTVTNWLAEKAVSPLTTDVFPVGDVARAFRHLAHGKNVGKVVVTFPEAAGSQDPPIARADRSYLITGGLGALGLKVADHLVEQGARTLILSGRSPGSQAARAAVAALETRGARVEILLADVADRERFASELRRLIAALPPLGGVVHAAGVLDDALLTDLTPERLTRVLGPKVNGAWNLHDLTKDMALDWFVSFSSIASVLGSAGQGNYAAANAWLDAFMHHRRALDLRGTSINWGPWASVGMAAGLDAKRRSQLRGKGLHPIPVIRALSALRWAIQRDLPQVVAAAIDWPAYAQQTPHVPRLLDAVAPAASFGVAHAQSSSATLTALVGLAPEERPRVLLAHLQRLLAMTLGFPANKAIDARDDFGDLGMDSLSAVEFMHHIEASLALTLSETAFEHQTLQHLVAHLLAVMSLDEAPAGRNAA
jgi:acyl transferase domain-containing protein/acyl carrier protein